VIGSAHWLLEEALLPQQALPDPEMTRKAASPYFSFTTSLISIELLSFLV
jgi:hypothetical protein